MRHFCRLFRMTVEEAFIRRVLPKTLFQTDFGHWYNSEIDPVTLEGRLVFDRLDPGNPNMAIFRDQDGPLNMEDGHIDKVEEIQRRVMVGSAT